MDKELSDFIEDMVKEQYAQHTKWGPWTLNLGEMRLEYSKKFAHSDKIQRYGIDLDRCNNSSQILDWIAQLSQKQWLSNEDLGHLVRAFDEIFNTLQSHVCGCGKDKKVNGPKIVKENYKKIIDEIKEVKKMKFV
jgi:hypothetical protein